MNRFVSKIDRCAERYRSARTSLEVLPPQGEWGEFFRPLLPQHIRGPNGIRTNGQALGDDDQGGAGEGRRELSWIWTCKRHWKRLIEVTEDVDRAFLDGVVELTEDLDPCKCSIIIL